MHQLHRFPANARPVPPKQCSKTAAGAPQQPQRYASRRCAGRSQSAPLPTPHQSSSLSRSTPSILLKFSFRPRPSRCRLASSSTCGRRVASHAMAGAVSCSCLPACQRTQRCFVLLLSLRGPRRPGGAGAPRPSARSPVLGGSSRAGQRPSRLGSEPPGRPPATYVKASTGVKNGRGEEWSSARGSHKLSNPAAAAHASRQPGCAPRRGRTSFRLTVMGMPAASSPAASASASFMFSSPTSMCGAPAGRGQAWAGKAGGGLAGGRVPAH